MIHRAAHALRALAGLYPGTPRIRDRVRLAATALLCTRRDVISEAANRVRWPPRYQAMLDRAYELSHSGEVEAAAEILWGLQEVFGLDDPDLIQLGWAIEVERPDAVASAARFLKDG